MPAVDPKYKLKPPSCHYSSLIMVVLIDVACSSLKSRANAIFYLIFTSINIPYRISPE